MGCIMVISIQLSFVLTSGSLAVSLMMNIVNNLVLLLILILEKNDHVEGCTTQMYSEPLYARVK
jgi:hypothetical protein